MRLAYLDEAGISETEATAVVAAVILASDAQYRVLEANIHQLMAIHLHPDRWEDFAFHAKELIWGGKAESPFPQKGTTDKERHAILEDVLRLPRALGLHFVVGYYRKPAPTKNAKQDSVLAHSFAHSACCFGINRYMRDFAPKELAMVIAEDRQDSRAAIRNAHAFFRDSAFPLMDEVGSIDEDSDVGSHIREGIFLAAKHDGLGLQIADAIACVVRREIDQSKNNERFVEALFGKPFSPLTLRAGDWNWRRYT